MCSSMNSFKSEIFKKFIRAKSEVLNQKESPKHDAIFHITACRDKVGLDVKYINSVKGRGVIALSAFSKGEFVLECRGQLINSEERQRRHRIYHSCVQAFMVDLLWHGKVWTIDTSWEEGTLGRLVNDDHINPNCKVKRIFVGGKPHLCFFALRDITHGEEITYKYKYGDFPWRTQGAECETDAGTNRDGLESDGSCANDPSYTKCSQGKSSSPIEDQASSVADNSHLISTNLPCNKLENQLVDIVPFESTCACLQQDRKVEGPDYSVSFTGGYREKNVDQTQAIIVRSQMVPLRTIPFTPTVLSTNLLSTPTYRLQKVYITTLTESTEDLCRLLWEHKSTTKVKLTKLCKVERETCHQYWPAKRAAQCCMPQYMLRKFNITDARDGLSCMSQQFQYTEQGVLRTDELINFIDQVHKPKVQFNKEGPVTVHFRVLIVRLARTRVLITFSIVLERMRDKEVVDLFQTVKTVRPAMVQTKDQYQLCYDAVLEYLGSFYHYATQHCGTSAIGKESTLELVLHMTHKTNIFPD